MYNCALFLSFLIIFNVGQLHENVVVLSGQDIQWEYIAAYLGLD